MGCKLLSRNIVEVIPRVKEHHRVVALAQVAGTQWLGVALIFPCHVVGNEVDDDLQARLVGAFYQRLKLCHAVFYLDG